MKRYEKIWKDMKDMKKYKRDEKRWKGMKKNKNTLKDI